MSRWQRIGSWAKSNSVPLLFAAGLAVRLVGLGDMFWYDESFTWNLARLPLDQMFAAIAADVHPPLWYLLAWTVYHLGGTGEIALRLPALAFGLVDLALIYIIAGRLLGRPVAVATLAAAACSPFLVYYSMEARMYSLLLTALLLALLGGLTRRWWLFGLAAVAALYTHNLAPISLAVVGLAVLAYHGRRAWWPLVWSTAVVGLLWVPGAALAVSQMSQMSAGYWIMPPTPGGVIMNLNTLIFYFLPDVLQPHAVLLSMILLLAVSGVAVSQALRQPHERRGIVTALVLLAGPIVLLLAASLVWRSVFLARGLILAVVGLCLVSGYVWTQVGPRGRRLALVVLVPFLVLVLGSQYAPGRGRDGNDTLTMIRLIRENWQKGDMFYHLSSGSWVGMRFYMADLQPQYVFQQPGNLISSITDAEQAALGMPLVTSACSVKWDRLWLYDSRSYYVTAAEEAEANKLEGQYLTIARWSFGEKQTLYLLDRSGLPVVGSPLTQQPVKRG